MLTRSLVIYSPIVCCLLYGTTNGYLFRSHDDLSQLHWNADPLEYTVVRDGQSWLESGPFFLHFNQTFYSSAPEEESSSISPLYLVEQHESNGTDVVLGSFTKLALRWSVSKTSPSHGYIWETSFKIFQDEPMFVFEQYFPVGLDAMSIGNTRETFKHVRLR